jgi:serine/threonine protein kinase
MFLGPNYDLKIDMWSVGCVTEGGGGMSLLTMPVVFSLSFFCGGLCFEAKTTWTPSTPSARSAGRPTATAGTSPIYAATLRYHPAAHAFSSKSCARTTPPKQPSERCRENPALTPQELDLLDGLLALDPSRRLDAATALSHAYFEDVEMIDPHGFPPFNAHMHEQDVRRNKLVSVGGGALPRGGKGRAEIGGHVKSAVKRAKR